MNVQNTKIQSSNNIDSMLLYICATQGLQYWEMSIANSEHSNLFQLSLNMQML